MEYMESKMQERYDAGNALYAELEKVAAERDALAANMAECQRLHAELNAILHPDGDGPANPSLCDLVSYVRSDRQEMTAQLHVLKTAAKFILNSKRRLAKRKAYAALADAVNKTPDQCLAPVRADAGRDGFIACLKHFHRYDDKAGMMAIDDRKAANQHHASILAGKE